MCTEPVFSLCLRCISGACLQVSAWDAEAGADVWDFLFKAKADCHGEGENRLWWKIQRHWGCTSHSLSRYNTYITCPINTKKQVRDCWMPFLLLLNLSYVALCFPEKKQQNKMTTAETCACGHACVRMLFPHTPCGCFRGRFVGKACVSVVYKHMW